MKQKKRKYVILIIIGVIIVLGMLNSVKYVFLQEDLLFFQLFGSTYQSDDSKEEQSQYIHNKEENLKQNKDIMQIGFTVQYHDIQLRDLNLFKTIDHKTLVYEKIAPGTSGKFDIILNSHEELNYQIIFKSENEKPSNLQFYISETEKKYDTLEELDDILKGSILKNEEKRIQISWEWCYETNEQNNQQDTIEAKKIREYNFLIYVKGIEGRSLVP